MRDFLRRYVFANFALKATSLAFAIALWVVVSHDPPAVVEVSVPIEFHRIPNNLEIASLNIPEAQVRARGPQRLIHQLRPQDVHVQVDLSDARPGERTFDLTAQQVWVPQDVHVMQVVPSQVRLAFDHAATREVEIRPRVIGTMAPGYRIGQVIATPPTVTVSGPEKRVDAVEAATTDPIDASGVLNRNTFVTNVYVTDPLVQLIKATPVHVTVIMEHTPANP